MDSHSRLAKIARQLAGADPEFHVALGAGAGDRRTNEYMRRLRELSKAEFKADHAEQKICGDTSLAVDYYFRDEATIVEVALGLPNPQSEFEKDILKALMAKELGNPVERLIFISRPGAIKKCSQPGRAAVIRWVETHHGVRIEVHELEGEARKRKRRAKQR